MRITVSVEINVEQGPGKPGVSKLDLPDDLYQAATDVLEMHGYKIVPDTWGGPGSRINVEMNF